MAKVIFERWFPPESVRSALAEHADVLPSDWTVTLSMDSDDSKPVGVLVEGDRTEHTVHLTSGDQVGSYLAMLAQNLDGSR